MQKEILFKAKRKDNNEWIYGFIIQYASGNNKIAIPSCRKDLIKLSNCIYGTYEVIPETISQYTGLKDKNDVKIFENDLIEFSFDIFTGDFDIKVGKGIVKFYDGAFYIAPFEIEDRKIEDIENEEWFLIYHVNLEELEVIGNVFDEDLR